MRGWPAPRRSSTSAPKRTGRSSWRCSFDVSGSMRMAQRTADARQAAEHIFASARDRRDEAAVFRFDTMLSRGPAVHGGPRQAARRRWTDVEPPYGQTSLYDAIASTARMVADARGRGGRAAAAQRGRRDHRRRRHAQPADAGEVSAIASGIDVPVYIVAVVAIDRRPAREHRGPAASGRGLEPSGARAQDRRRAVHRQRAGAREHRGAPDRRRAAAPVRARVRGVGARRLAAAWRSARARTTTSVRARSGYDGASPASELRARSRGCGSQRTSHRPDEFRTFLDGGNDEEVVLVVPVLALALSGTTACATKKFVRTNVGEVNDKVDTLSKSVEENQERTTANEGRIGEVDQKARGRGGSAGRQAGPRADEAYAAAEAVNAPRRRDREGVASGSSTKSS